ncbi:MAG: hypothetical protein JXB49_34190 [Bacteroidales bacterium]|nr:hypothetical protein [Bacteroidales bacterium]
MKNICILFITIIFVSCNSEETHKKKDNDLIQQSFKAFKTAMIAKDGENAVKYISSKTIEYYDKILDKTIYADWQETYDLSYMERIMVFRLRHQVDTSLLFHFTGEDLLKYSIKSKMFAMESIEGMEYHDVEEISEGKAKVNIALNSFFTQAFDFYYEEGLWKMDIMAVIDLAEKYFDKTMEDITGDRNVVLLEMLSAQLQDTIDIFKISKPLKYKDSK